MVYLSVANQPDVNIHRHGDAAWVHRIISTANCLAFLQVKHTFHSQLTRRLGLFFLWWKDRCLQKHSSIHMCGLRTDYRPESLANVTVPGLESRSTRLIARP